MGYESTRRSLDNRQSISKPQQAESQAPPQRSRVKPKMWYQRIRWKKVALCVFALYVVFNLVGGVFEIFDLKKQQAIVIEQLDQAYVEQAKLQEKIDYMNTEEAIEKAAREKLGLVKPGEIVVIRANETNSQ